MSMGSYEVVSDVRTPECSLRLLRLFPAREVFSHFHRRTTQIYFVIEGEATAMLGNTQKVLQPNQSLRVPPGTPHGIASQGRALVLSISIPPLDPDDQHPAP